LTHRLSETLALVREEVILACGLSQLVPLQGAHGDGDHLPPVDTTVRLQIRSFDPLLEGVTKLERNSRGTGADGETAEPPRMQRRSEERGAGADVGTNDVWAIEAEGIGHADEEFAHGPRRHQLVAALGTAEPRQIDGDEVRVLGEPRAGGLEGILALRPWAE